MTSDHSWLRLNRLRIGSQGRVAYEQRFHDGVNIIRGQNSSGKSTIADFIFFVLGGEFDDWKGAARRCDVVQAEVDTPRGKLTLMRRVASAQESLSVFFGSMEDAERSSIEGWERFPPRRHGGRESFSQVLFRSLLIPEAQSEGASNVTMHQVLRLCYSDQRTPASRLFRFELFDTQSIREAVGDLVCGISGYEIYEIGLKLRELQKEFDDTNAELNGLLRALPRDKVFFTPDGIDAEIAKLSSEESVLRQEIEDVDDLLEPGQVKDYLAERRVALLDIAKQRKSLQELESNVANVEFELREVTDYERYLKETMDKLSFAEATLTAIGSIEFTHCPACGIELELDVAKQHCVVCKSPLDMEREKSRYNLIRLDMEIQARESRQLIAQKNSEVGIGRQDARRLRHEHGQKLAEFELEFGGGNGPREAFLATRMNRLGHIEAEIEFLLNNLETAEEVKKLTDKRTALSGEMEELRTRNDVLRNEAKSRRSVALTRMSDVCAEILRSDLERQAEFLAAETIQFDFRNDSIAVDGALNFAESSNVYLKNTAIFGMFLAAGLDTQFFHPRFVLIDNVEDKGMEVARSHLFQRIIVERATELRQPYQVIFTTSMMNPELELDEYVIGPAYTSERKSLEFV